FVRIWRAFFMRLERLHRLDATNTAHIWLLHYLFLNDINVDCRAFIKMWNHHPISGLGGDQTPSDLEFMGRLKHGEYTQEYEDVHPELLDRYFGADIDSDSSDDQRGAGSTGAADYLDDIEHLVAADQNANVQNAPVIPATKNSPFSTAETEQLFLDMIEDNEYQEVVPAGFALLENEWDEGGYEASEVIKMRGGKQLKIPLPFDDWWPRAVKWSRSLSTMLRVINDFEM
ncbi:hypothetical protein BDZ89DRAFT_941049, partial [Hymenopellis radicata]